jgi:hypothetical protein
MYQKQTKIVGNRRRIQKECKKKLHEKQQQKKSVGKVRRGIWK